MKALAFIVLVPALFAQDIDTSAQNLLNASRSLMVGEIATILSASRRALSAKTFRLSSLLDGRRSEVLIGTTGQPKIIRTTSSVDVGVVSGVVGDNGRIQTSHEDVITMIDYTDRPARHCNGLTEPGEMAIEYTFRSSTQAWTATARRHDVGDFGQTGIAPAFEMLQDGLPVMSGELRRIRDRWARAFVSPWVPSAAEKSAVPPTFTGDPTPNVLGNPAPNDAIQSLWIDTELLLPLRWEVSKRGILSFGFDFTYASIDLRLPAGTDEPECIP